MTGSDDHGVKDATLHVNLENDSVSFQRRVFEGRPARRRSSRRPTSLILPSRESRRARSCITWLTVRDNFTPERAQRLHGRANHRNWRAGSTRREEEDRGKPGQGSSAVPESPRRPSRNSRIRLLPPRSSRKPAIKTRTKTTRISQATRTTKTAAREAITTSLNNKRERTARRQAPTRERPATRGIKTSKTPPGTSNRRPTTPSFAS